jgi:hypothetical protein
MEINRQTVAMARQASGIRPSISRKLDEVFLQTMDTSRLLLAFLAFGAACTTLWAWLLASASDQQQGSSISRQPGSPPPPPGPQVSRP